jgi:hypothetical protein
MITKEANLSIRLDKLERQLNFWRVLVVLSVFVCGVSIDTQLRASPTRIDATAVVAQEFDLVNPSGRVTARLAPLPDNPDSPYLALKYPNDQAAISLGVESGSGSSFSLLSNDGHPRVLLGEHADGPAISLYDEDDKLRVAANAKGQATQIAIYDKNTKRIWVVPSN